MHERMNVHECDAYMCFGVFTSNLHECECVLLCLPRILLLHRCYTHECMYMCVDVFTCHADDVTALENAVDIPVRLAVAERFQIQKAK